MNEDARTSARAGHASYRVATLPAPFGPVRVTEGPAGLVSIELIPSALSVLAARLRTLHPSAPRLSEVKSHASGEALALYFAGRCQTFALPIDWSLTSGFLRSVLVQLSRLPFGVTTSYRELALAVGKAGGARAVGAAMSKNPLPIVVPCHRVLAAGSRLGGFTGGLAVKRWLLAHEGLVVSSGGVVEPAGNRPRPGSASATARQLPLLS